MPKKSILTLISSILFMLIFFTGCSSENTQDKINDGLNVYNWSSALGSVSETDLDKTRLSYSINLTNESNKNIFIKSIQPSINESLKDKILSEEILLTVNKEVKPKETIQIDGEIILDTKGSTKSDLDKLSLFITDIRVTSEETIKL